MARRVFPHMEVELAQPEALTPRQGEILVMAANGMKSKEIAGRLGISEDTVNCHLDNLKDQFCAISRAHLISQGWLHGMLKARGLVKALVLFLTICSFLPTARVYRGPVRTASRTTMSAVRAGRREIDLKGELA